MTLNFENIKKYILVSSKLLSIIICLYYIFQFKNYEVSWNLFRYFFPSWASKIDIGLSTVGTYILLIPLIIVIASFFEETTDKDGKLIKQSFIISTMGKIFGLGIVIISLVMQIVKGNLYEYLDLRFITIYKQLTLDAKRELFVNEFTQQVFNLHIKAQAKLEFLMLHVQQKYMDLFEKTLVKIPSTEIKGYAQRIVNELLISYDSYEKAQPSIWRRSMVYIQDNVTLKGVMITLGLCIVAYGIYYLGKSPYIDNLKKQADLHIDSIRLNQEGTSVASTTIKENVNHVEVSKDLAQGLSNLTQVVSNIDKELEVVKVVTNNNIMTLQNHTTVLNVIVQHFPQPGEFEKFMYFLVNMFNLDYDAKPNK